MRDTFIFYRSFFEAINELPDTNKAELFTAICDYALNFKDPELLGISKTVWILIKPNLDANIKRFENGSKAKKKQNVSKTEAKQKQGESKTEANKDKDVDKDKDKDKELNISFVCFWDLYGNKKGDRAACEKKWGKLKDQEREKIMQTLPTFLKQIKDKQFQPLPATYLNQKRWNDELAPVKSETTYVATQNNDW